MTSEQCAAFFFCLSFSVHLSLMLGDALTLHILSLPHREKSDATLAELEAGGKCDQSVLLEDLGRRHERRGREGGEKERRRRRERSRDASTDWVLFLSRSCTRLDWGFPPFLLLLLLLLLLLPLLLLLIDCLIACLLD